MKVKRYISSIPLRSAKETWDSIRDLVSGSDSVDIDQLNDASSVLHSLISDEIFENTPIVMTGVSHRLIIYLRYRQDAIEENKSVDAINWNPTAGDWKMFIPCDEENYEWVTKTLGKRAPRIIVHKPADKPYDSASKGSANETNDFDIDWGVMGQ